MPSSTSRHRVVAALFVATAALLPGCAVLMLMVTKYPDPQYTAWFVAWALRRDINYRFGPYSENPIGRCVNPNNGTIADCAGLELAISPVVMHSLDDSRFDLAVTGDTSLARPLYLDGDVGFRVRIDDDDAPRVARVSGVLNSATTYHIPFRPDALRPIRAMSPGIYQVHFVGSTITPGDLFLSALDDNDNTIRSGISFTGVGPAQGRIARRANSPSFVLEGGTFFPGVVIRTVEFDATRVTRFSAAREFMESPLNDGVLEFRVLQAIQRESRLDLAALGEDVGLLAITDVPMDGSLRVLFASTRASQAWVLVWIDALEPTVAGDQVALVRGRYQVIRVRML